MDCCNGSHEIFPYSNFQNLNLDWILGEMKRLGCSFTELRKYVTEENKKLSGRLDEVEKWINDFDPEFINDYIKKYLTGGVVFGLTDDGYFVAHITDSWDKLKFGTTGLDTFPAIQPEYGHLTVSY